VTFSSTVVHLSLPAASASGVLAGGGVAAALAQLVDQLLTGGIVFQHVGQRGIGRSFCSTSGSLAGCSAVAVGAGQGAAESGAVNSAASSNRIHGTGASISFQNH
jgi:hypothetical protein